MRSEEAIIAAKAGNPCVNSRKWNKWRTLHQFTKGILYLKVSEGHQKPICTQAVKAIVSPLACKIKVVKGRSMNTCYNWKEKYAPCNNKWYLETKIEKFHFSKFKSSGHFQLLYSQVQSLFFLCRPLFSFTTSLTSNSFIIPKSVPDPNIHILSNITRQFLRHATI